MQGLSVELTIAESEDCHSASPATVFSDSCAILWRHEQNWHCATSHQVEAITKSRLPDGRPTVSPCSHFPSFAALVQSVTLPGTGSKWVYYTLSAGDLGRPKLHLGLYVSLRSRCGSTLRVSAPFSCGPVSRARLPSIVGSLCFHVQACSHAGACSCL